MGSEVEQYVAKSPVDLPAPLERSLFGVLEEVEDGEDWGLRPNPTRVDPLDLQPKMPHRVSSLSHAERRC